jgi:hypothetical protein
VNDMHATLLRPVTGGSKLSVYPPHMAPQVCLLNASPAGGDSARFAPTTPIK